MSLEDCGESFDDSVDPRVQVELERLNAATNEINRLEVDLDEAKTHFKSILCESSEKIEVCSKQHGEYIASSLPYYEARLNAKVALRETEKSAAAFEKANSAHAAAKEMVFLAEEGLQTEGRTFDHAWQEMLNHATMRVNEEESARTECESRLKTSVIAYELALDKVDSLRKTLKKAIKKSRPYFELRIHYSQVLDEQKTKVKLLEQQVAQTKLQYADTLKNLERISDEIHQKRKWRKTAKERNKSDGSSHKEDCCEARMSSSWLSQHSQHSQQPPVSREKASPTSGSSLPDTDFWSESSDAIPSQALAEDSDSSSTGVPDSESDTISHSLSDLMPMGTCAILNVVTSPSNNVNQQTDSNKQYCWTDDCEQSTQQQSQWTEIKLLSSSEEAFLKMESHGYSDTHEDFDIPYAPLTELEMDSSKEKVSAEEMENDVNGKLPASPPSDPSTTDKSLSSWLTATKKEKLPVTPSKTTNLRRQSLDVLWNNATGEKMKEILCQGILKLNISTINERRNSDTVHTEPVVEPEGNNEGKSESNESPRQFGLQFFSKRSRQDEDGGTPTKKKQVTPSPLERTLSFLNHEDEHPSDGLPSMEALSEEQLSALLLDTDLAEQYRDVV